MEIASLLAEAKKHNPDCDYDVLNRAYSFAAGVFQDLKSDFDVPLIQHALTTSHLLAELHQDPDCLAAALLHDVIINAGESVEKIRRFFGTSIAKLVDGATRLSRVRWEKLDKANVASLQKMFLAMADDVRVVLIKLAEQLENMYSLKPLASLDLERVAKETQFIFAPLAGKLGIWSMKRELEDLAFKNLEPINYDKIVNFLAESRESRERAIRETILYLKRAMAEQNIFAEITGRPKHIYSIYKKMARTQRDFSAIYDVQAVRVVVKSVADCYAALDVIHRTWTPILEEFDDYIAKPKANGYRSLHTAVLGPREKPLEIQVRTQEMNQDSEYGVVSHWRYKDCSVFGASIDAKVAYLRILLEWQQELSEQTGFHPTLKTLPFDDYVYVLTPKGDVLDLLAGSTPIDFAYRVHTDLGHRCRGAKVNGKLVSLDYKLRNGDRVDIVTGKEKRPSRDWLNPQLGYVFTPRVKQKIRQWFRAHDRDAHIGRGREILDRALRQLGIREKNYDDITPLFNFKRPDDLLEAIGYGDISSHRLKTKLIRFYKESAVDTAPLSVAPILRETLRVWVGDDQDLLTRTALCCRPLPGDAIIGFVTKGRGVTIHRRDCHNILRQEDRDRLIAVKWGQGRQFYNVNIRIETLDAKKILKEMAAIVETEDARIVASNLGLLERDPISVIQTILEISDTIQLNRILNKIKAQPCVVEVKKQIH